MIVVSVFYYFLFWTNSNMQSSRCVFYQTILYRIKDNISLDVYRAGVSLRETDMNRSLAQNDVLLH